MPTQNIKTEWNLSQLYKNFKELDQHVEEIDAAFTKFAKKYEKKDDWLKDEKKLKQALDESEKLWDVDAVKPAFYLHLATDLDAENEKLQAKSNQIDQKMSNIVNKVVFFELKLGKIDRSLQKKVLKNTTFVKYHYYLKKLWENAKYDLSEPEEKILNLTSLTRSSMWVNGVDKNISKRTVTFEGKEMPIPAALGKFSDLPTKKRRKLWDLVMDKLEEVSDFAESEINAVITNKKISDELRGFEKPYSATLVSNENEEEVVEALRKSVTESFKVAHQFYKLKAKILKEKSLTYADRAAVVGEIKTKFTFTDSVDLLHSSFAKTDKEFADILNRMLQNGCIDAYPRKGKTGGAYMTKRVNLPTFVLLNHVDTFRSLTTFAHEMGHAINYELSTKQDRLYQMVTTGVTETASTLFENFAFEEVFERLNEKEKVIALHDRINDSVSTIFRQIALYNFELDLHKVVREEGWISKDRLVKLMNEHMSTYLGPAVTLAEKDGYMFVSWSHIRYYFYVYTYAYGELISAALYKRYKEDNSYIEEIKKFLSAGGSKPPYEIFKEIGIDTKDPNFWKEGLKKIEKDIKRLEDLTS